MVIPGAQKSGTTTLFEVLCRHRRVVRPAGKESQFFALPPETVAEHLSWYGDGRLRRGEAGGDDVLIDASTFYLYSDRAPAQIARHCADPRIVIVLRDPVRRAVSAYWHMRRKTPVVEARGFEEIVGCVAGRLGPEVGGAAPGRLRAAERSCLAGAVEAGAVDRSYVDPGYLAQRTDTPFAARFEDPLWPYRYLEGSLYSRHVERYEAVFGADRVTVVILEELLRRPKEVLRRVYRALGLPADAAITAIPHENAGGRAGGLGRAPALWLRAALRRLGAGRLADRVERAWGPRPELPDAVARRAARLLRPEYEYWADRDPASRLWGGRRPAVRG